MAKFHFHFIQLSHTILCQGISVAYRIWWIWCTVEDLQIFNCMELDRRRLLYVVESWMDLICPPASHFGWNYLSPLVASFWLKLLISVAAFILVEVTYFLWCLYFGWSYLSPLVLSFWLKLLISFGAFILVGVTYFLSCLCNHNAVSWSFRIKLPKICEESYQWQ